MNPILHKPAVRRQANLFFPAQSGEKRVLLYFKIFAACAISYGPKTWIPLRYIQATKWCAERTQRNFLSFAAFAPFAGDIPMLLVAASPR
jgi:hypothetical protein